MAKKNSTKTATKEAIQSAEPRIQTFTGWTGMDISGVPLDAEDRPTVIDTDWHDAGQTDAKPNFLCIQNNVEPSNNGTLETKWELKHLANQPSGVVLSGVATTFKDYIYAAGYVLVPDPDDPEKLLQEPRLQRFNLGWKEDHPWENIPITNHNGDKTKHYHRIIRSMIIFQDKLILLEDVGSYNSDDMFETEFGQMYDGKMSTILSDGISNAIHVPEPVNAPNVTGQGITLTDTPQSDSVSRMRFVYVYCNKYGSTTQSPSKTVYSNVAPVEFQSNKFVKISQTVHCTDKFVTGIDIYMTLDENQSYIFCGHATPDASGSWNLNWLGALMDTSQWTQSSLLVPTQNTTDGVDACFVDQYDGRLYFYGGKQRYRLYIGGNPGNELTVATGQGGAFVDIEPGSGQEVRKVLKFKTYNGATIVTLLTHHPNTNKGARFNLIETNITVTNEYSAQGWTYEKVDDTVGCSSYFGADTFLDGLYAVNRYGVAYTTKTMENQNNLKEMYCSEQIKPVFTSSTGKEVAGSRMICVNDIIYLSLASDLYSADDSAKDVILHDLFFCYDLNTKSWYTQKLFPSMEPAPIIKHIFPIDNYEHYEGIGIVTLAKNDNDGGIYLAPTTGNTYQEYYDEEGKPKPGYPKVESVIQSHELSPRVPVTNMFYVNQLEFHFDYLCSPEGLELIIEGEDYYGRMFMVHKLITADTIEHNKTVYARIDKYIYSLKFYLQGKAHYRMTHVNMKCFQQSSSVGVHYGMDTWHKLRSARKKTTRLHHKIDSYNTLEKIIMT